MPTRTPLTINRSREGITMASALCKSETAKASQQITASRDLGSATLRGIGFGKLLAGGLAFVLLTVGIFWYQFYRIQVGDQAPRWDQLQWGYLFLILLCLPVETVASSLRVWLICRVLEPGVGLWTCFKAEWANVAIAMLTPSQSGGGPGQIYLLSRGGASVGTALTVSLLSFVGTMVGLLCMGLYSLLISGLAHTGPLFAAATWTIVSISTAMVLAAIWPGLFRVMIVTLSRAVHRTQGRRRPPHDHRLPSDARTRSAAERLDRLTAKLVDIIYTYRNDVRRFLRVGKATFVSVCLLSLVFLFSRAIIPYLCLRYLGIQTSTFRHVIEVQMALIFLAFFAPTPGGAGVAEAASLSIMDTIVPVGFAPYYTLLWRFLTLYLAAIAGLLCLMRSLAEDAQRIIGPREGERRNIA
jgi:uncharacterized protein (TIRG00374 family)